MSKLPLLKTKADETIEQLRQEIESLKAERDKAIIENAENYGNYLELLFAEGPPIKAKQWLDARDLENQAKGIDWVREKAYQKEAFMLIDYGIDGSACKRINAWLNDELENLKQQAEKLKVG